RSLDLARAQGALAWEQRTPPSLGDRPAPRGRGTEARDRLAAVFARFTQGHGTRDLLEAKARLESRG
ncbi:MAG: hypothetical protein ABW067_01835, partial [Rhizobacter sp.]